MRRFKIILLGICVMALLWIVAVRLLTPKEITDPYLPEHLRGSPEKPKSPASHGELITIIGTIKALYSDCKVLN